MKRYFRRRFKMSNKLPFYKNKNFYKKQLNKLIIVIIAILIIFLLKKINCSLSNKVIRIIDKGTNYEFSIKKDGKIIVEKLKNVEKIPEKIMSVFKLDKSKDEYISPICGKIYKTFGNIKNFGNKELFNKGVDIIPSEDRNVLSIADGKVIKIENKGSLGYFVTVEYEEIQAVYGHLMKIYVSDECEVLQGEKIGSLGDFKNGNRYLHFEVWKNKSPIDPSNIIKFSSDGLFTTER